MNIYDIFAEELVYWQVSAVEWELYTVINEIFEVHKVLSNFERLLF